MRDGSLGEELQKILDFSSSIFIQESSEFYKRGEINFNLRILRLVY